MIKDIQAGDVVWVVEREQDGSAADYSGYIFLAHVRRYVICASPVNDRIEVDIVLRSLCAATAFDLSLEGIFVYPENDCYTNRNEAARAYEMEL